MKKAEKTKISSQDRDGDGLLDKSKWYKLANSNVESVLLRNRNGRTYSDDSTSHWNAIKAIQQRYGYKVLCEGEGKKEGQFRWLSIDQSGVIQEASRFRRGDDPITQGWERIFGDVIQKDGVIGRASDKDDDGFLDQTPYYQIYDEGRIIALKKDNGEPFTQKSSRPWKPLKAIGTRDGFDILLRTKGRKKQQFRVLDVDLDGNTTKKTEWLNGKKALFAGWNLQFQKLINNQASKNTIQAASTESIDESGQLIYTATTSDETVVTYALKENAEDLDSNLSIGTDNGEVRLFGKKSSVIPKQISFTVIATDSAGNSSELDVTVDLSLRESTDTNDQLNENASNEGTISALSLEQPEGSTGENNEAVTDADSETTSEVISISNAINETEASSQDSNSDDPTESEEDTTDLQNDTEEEPADSENQKTTTSSGRSNPMTTPDLQHLPYRLIQTVVTPRSTVSPTSTHQP